MGRENSKRKYKTKNYTYDFQQYQTIRSFGEIIYTLKASIVEDEECSAPIWNNCSDLK